MDVELFEETCRRYIGAKRKKGPIGTLSEKTLHVILKNCFEPDISKQEVKVGKFYADILNDSGITEIQTGNFGALRKKLAAFLPEYNVRIVYPVSRIKNVVWIDPETGETSAPHKSPKKGVISDILPELYRISEFLLDEKLIFTVVLLDTVEYRLKNGWGRDGKRGSERYDLIPVSYIADADFCVSSGYSGLLPEGLPDSFDSKIFSAVTKRVGRNCSYSLGALNCLGLIEKIRGEGRSVVYYKIEKKDGID